VFKQHVPVIKKKGDTNESKAQNSHRYPSDPSCHHNYILSRTITLSCSPSIVAVQYHSPEAHTTTSKHTSYSFETANLPRQCAIRPMTLKPDLSSCSYTTRWQVRHKTEPSKQLFDLYFMSNTPTAQASMLLGLSWSITTPRFRSSRPSVADRSERKK